MSGHSKWSTIKRKKEATDIARGKLFSKLGKAISVAVKTGGGPDPEANPKLRVAVDAAKTANMPKENIDRAIARASGEGESLEEITYEGFGPHGIGILVETATDSRNRTGQEIKNIFDRGEGSLASPGAVSFNFETKGMILLSKQEDVEGQMLSVIDMQVEDVEETEDAIEVYVSVDQLSQVKNQLSALGFDISGVEIVRRPKNLQKLEDESEAKKAFSFLEKLQDHDDVQKVYTNLDVPQELALKLVGQ